MRESLEEVPIGVEAVQRHVGRALRERRRLLLNQGEDRVVRPSRESLAPKFVSEIAQEVSVAREHIADVRPEFGERAA